MNCIEKLQSTFKSLYIIIITHVDGRFASAQTALMLQEETIRRNERERKIITDKVTNLERTLNATESEKKQLQDRNSKLKTVSITKDFITCSTVILDY